jgi:hypothetical protein
MNNDMVSTVLYNKDSVKIKVVHGDPGHAHLVAIFGLCSKTAASNLPPI